MKKKMKKVYEDEDTQSEKKETQMLLEKMAGSTIDFKELLILTNNVDEKIRLKAIQRLCPCQIKDEVDMFWERIFQAADDPCPKVRYQSLHNMCDGCPPEWESKVAEALEKFNRDPDKDIKRTAHKVLASYLRTGKWNIL